MRRSLAGNITRIDFVFCVLWFYSAVIVCVVIVCVFCVLQFHCAVIACVVVVVVVSSPHQLPGCGV